MSKIVVVLLAFAILGAGCASRGASPPNSGQASIASGALPQILQGGSGARVFIQLASGSGPLDIAAGPSRMMWFTENTSGRIGRLNIETLKVVSFPLASPGSQPFGIAQGPDGNMWFTELAGGAIGSITAAGSIAEYPLPTPGAQPRIITAGPDGNLWFTEGGADKIGSITTSGVIREFATNGSPWGIVAGNDGNLWFTDNTPSTSYVGKITTGGVMTEYPAAQCGACLTGILAATDGNLYFLFDGANTIGRLSPSTGTVTTFQATGTHESIAARPGNFGRILVYTPPCCINPIHVYKFDITSDTATLRESLPYASAADFLANGVDGNIYYVLHDIDAIVVTTTRTMFVTPNVVTLSGIGSTQVLTVSELEFSNRLWSAKTSNPAVATVAPGSDQFHFVITAQGAGSCTVTIADTTGNSVRVPVTVTL